MTPYYEDSAVTIYHGDCREILPTLPKVDLVLTDPPYGIGYDATQNQNADSGRMSNGGRWKRYNHTGWDSKCPNSDVFSEVLGAGNTVILWGGNYFLLPSRGKWLIWNKIQRGVMTDGEMAWTNMDGQVCIFDMARTDVYINNRDAKVHPTQKPTALMTWCVSLVKPEPQTILDPFMGSGTTLRAAKDLGRKAIGIELEEEYAEIAANRMAQEVLPL